MTQLEWFAIGFSLQVALAAMVLVVPAAVAAAYWLSHHDFRGKRW